jgi:hypothetical protein
MARWVERLSRVILVAMSLSLVSLQLITLVHQEWISWGECVFSWITRSHLVTQIRWAASEVDMRRSLVAPCVVLLVIWLVSASGRVRLPLPSRMLILRSGHNLRACGHSASARFHTILGVPEEQAVSMWSMESSSSHMEHCWRCLSSGTVVCDQNRPSFCMLCMALYMNCLTHGRSTGSHTPCQIVLFFFFFLNNLLSGFWGTPNAVSDRHTELLLCKLPRLVVGID